MPPTRAGLVAAFGPIVGAPASAILIAETGRSTATGGADSHVAAARRAVLRLAGVRIDAATEAAAKAGLREGDVILSIANSEVGSVKEFEAAVAKADKSKPVSVLFRRGEWAQYALIRPAR